MLPKDAVIGVSCNNVGHVKAAVKEGADYVGIGAVWGTKSKSLTSPIIGVRRVGVMLEALDGTNVKAVAIGAPWPMSCGINLQANTYARRYQVNKSSTHLTRDRVIDRSCSRWHCCHLGNRCLR
jgi:hypothetical protein